MVVVERWVVGWLMLQLIGFEVDDVAVLDMAVFDTVAVLDVDIESELFEL